MLTVRLDRDTERRLDALTNATGRTRSEIVRDAIRAYEPVQADERTVYARFSDVIGVAQIGGDRARKGERILRETFARKRAKRTSR